MNDLAIHLQDEAAESFRADVLAGLRHKPRRIPPKYFYDARGAALFDQICQLEEYYPPRAELEILETHAAEIARALGTQVLLVEFGVGTAEKSTRLLRAMTDPAGYVAVDLCVAQIEASAKAVGDAIPGLPIVACLADFTAPLPLTHSTAGAMPRARRTVVYFPGSTIGNFDPAEALKLLRRIRRKVGPGGAALIAVDRKKDPAVIERAYNDTRGVTAAFNLNLLTRINRELGGDFDLGAFQHLALYDPWRGRAEMHLQSRRDQIVCVDRQCFSLRAGETLHTENSYKYAPEEFAALATEAGFAPGREWHDAEQRFGVYLLQA
ncbi:MAG TPA: L-histidine N(alpha)-methyltransferase [Candidatus Binatia bacterium]|nr:L-histidine N(alpha)-methyltransferase [Candidatus Binatia bacterium]